MVGGSSFEVISQWGSKKNFRMQDGPMPLYVSRKHLNHTWLNDGLPERQLSYLGLMHPITEGQGKVIGTVSLLPNQRFANAFLTNWC